MGKHQQQHEPNFLAYWEVLCHTRQIHIKLHIHSEFGIGYRKVVNIVIHIEFLPGIFFKNISPGSMSGSIRSPAYGEWKQTSRQCDKQGARFEGFSKAP